MGASVGRKVSAQHSLRKDPYAPTEPPQKKIQAYKYAKWRFIFTPE